MCDAVKLGKMRYWSPKATSRRDHGPWNGEPVDLPGKCQQFQDSVQNIASLRFQSRSNFMILLIELCTNHLYTYIYIILYIYIYIYIIYIPEPSFGTEKSVQCFVRYTFCRVERYLGSPLKSSSFFKRALFVP